MKYRILSALLACSSAANAQTPQLTPAQDSVKAVVEWVTKNAIPISFRPSLLSDDRIARLVGDARLVGLGEGTHGTREFYVVKAALVRSLIVEKGFRTIAFEGNYAAVQALDDYVFAGTGTPETALSALDGFNWETEEMAVLLRWIRAFNANGKNREKVRFVGIDVLNFYPSIAAALKYIAENDGNAATRLTRPFVSLLMMNVSGIAATQGRFDDLGPSLSVDQVEQLVAATAQVRDYLDGHRPPARDTLRWLVARQHATVALQRAEVVRTVRGWYTSSGPSASALYARAAQDAASLQGFLDKANPVFADTVRNFLLEMSKPSLTRTQYIRSMSPEQRWKYEGLASQLIAQVDVKRATDPDDIPPARWDSLSRQARTMRALLYDFREYLSRATPVTNEPRDPSLAENVAWALSATGPDGKVIVWAHDIHVQASPYAIGSETMGSALRKRFGKEYVTIGTVFNQGGFQARILPVPRDSLELVRPFVVGPALPGSVESVLAEARLPAFAIDVRSLPATGIVRAWFSGQRSMRYIGNGFNPAREQDFYRMAKVAQDFDVLILVESTTRAEPLATARQKYRITQ